MKSRGIAAIVLALGAHACAPEEPGAVTAQIVWPGQEISTSKQGLRAVAVPPQIARLQIVALDAVDGSTLAETNLVTSPGEGEEQLNPMGGTWTLKNVKVGTNRMIIARAFLGALPDPRVSGLFIFEGEITGIEVRPGQLVDAGPLRLRMRDGVRYPPLDTEAPDSPSPPMVMSVPEGEALWVGYPQPPQPDVAGYIFALSLTGRTATITRGLPIQIGQELAPGVTVVDRLAAPTPEIKTISGLENGRSYTILIYAYDLDLNMLPLNYSTPASASGVPLDTRAPGQVSNLTIGPGTAPGTVDVSFVSPGEDDMTGTVAQYQIRTSTSVVSLTDPGRFAELPAIAAPPPVAPGEIVRATYTFAELRQNPQALFWIGVRAVDLWENKGPVVAVPYTITATLPPAVLDIAPPIVIAGNELTIRGRNLGNGGLVTLTTTGTVTETIPLDVRRYTDFNVTVTIPLEAKSGVVTVRRLPDGAEVEAYVVVMRKIVDAFDEYPAPFEFLSAETAPGVPIAALYRELPISRDFEGAIERVINLSPDPTPLVPYVSVEQSTAIAGTFDPTTQRFFFIAANEQLNMTLASVSTSSITPLEERTPSIAAVGGADRVALQVLPGGVAGQVRALLAFTLNGTVRTATIADLRTQGFPIFNAFTSTAAQYDRVTIRSKPDGETYMAYRAIAGGVAELVLRVNPDPWTTVDFTEIPAPDRPVVGASFELIGVPTNLGDEEIVIVYEEEDPLTGALDIRLLTADDYGERRGFAPFDVDANGRTLEDVGLVLRQGEVWIAILAARGASVQYTEVPLDALQLGEAQRGSYRGVILDSAAGGSLGRIGCKTIPANACPIAWIGENAQVLFVRR